MYMIYKELRGQKLIVKNKKIRNLDDNIILLHYVFEDLCELSM